MTIDENAFFRQMTLRICGSLDPHIVLERCYLYLKDFIPLSSIHFLLFDTNTFSANIPALFSPDRRFSMERDIVPPERFRREASALWKSMNPVGIINRPADSQYYLEFFQTAGVGPDISTLMMRLEMDENRIGALVLIADGTNRYTTEHANLVLLLHEPFAIALSNALKHKDVRNIKTILEDDNRLSL